MAKGKFKVSKKAAISLLKALGFENADKYNDKRLQQRMEEFADVASDEAQAKLKTGSPDHKLCVKLLAAITKGDGIEIVGDGSNNEEKIVKTAKSEKKVSKKTKAKVEDEDKDKDEVEDENTDENEDEDDEKPAKKKNKSEKKDKSEKKEKKNGNTRKGPGVIAYILELLKKASKKNPISKADILSALTEKFPERKEDSMKSTINHQVPSMLRGAGHNIQKNEHGYFIAKE